MKLIYKTYNVASGFLEFKFYYDDTVAGDFMDFNITDIGEHKIGFDHSDNLELSIDAANMDITISDYTGDNYSKFKALKKVYSETYPFNFNDVFIMELLLNGETELVGVLDEVEDIKSGPDEKIERKLNLTFVDGINKYKDIPVGNPAFLQYLYNKSLIKRSASNRPNSFGYGFGSIQSVTDFLGNRTGYELYNIETGDRDTNLKSVIVQLFKLFNPLIQVNFENEYLFGEFNVPVQDMVTIDEVNARRICSNLLGRYVILDKSVTDTPLEIRNGSGGNDHNWNKSANFPEIYEDENWKTFFHNWSGNPSENPQLLFQLGIKPATVSDILKALAKNLFSYYGFEKTNSVFFRHKRFTTDPEELTGILSMKKNITFDKIQGAKIEDQYISGKYALEGKNISTSELPLINFKIPLNTIKTTVSYEYRMNYFVGNQEKRVIYMYDKQLGQRDLPMNIIAKAEWEAHRDCRDQYEIKLRGVNRSFPKTYFINKLSYQGKVRPIEIAKNYLTNQTTMQALEIDTL